MDEVGSLPESIEKKLRAYLSHLLDANQHFNLTAVRDPEEAWSRHIVESTSLLPLLGRPARLLDVGSGGGVPGMILGICRPEVLVTLLEATNKKARFLEQTRADLGLENVAVVCERAETAAQPGSPHREVFDVVTARAVAPLPVLLELTVPFLRVGGTLLAIKGDKAKEEMAASRGALSSLHAEIRTALPHHSGTVVVVEKMARTPKEFPRRPGEPKRRPL